jgi:hypothetical protein
MLHNINIFIGNINKSESITLLKEFRGGRKELNKNIIKIFVVTLLITAVSSTIGTSEESQVSQMQNIIIDNPGDGSMTVLDVIDQQQTTYTDEERIQVLDGGGLAQSFEPSASPLTAVSVLWLKSSGTPEFAYYFIEIRSDIHSSSYLRKIQIGNSQLQTGLVWYTWDFTDLSVTVGGSYWIVCYASTPTIYTTPVEWCYGSPGDPYPDGGSMINYGPPLYWAAYDLWGDFCFRTYKTGSGNNPPNTPITPSGPVTGTVGVAYSYTTSADDPDGDDISYGWDWDGDSITDEYSGLHSSGATCAMSHSWSNPGTYQVKVKAKDEHNSLSGFSPALTVTITATNQPPNKPGKPNGPNQGAAGTSYTYTASTTDPEGDQVWYKWSWGDNISNWDGPYNSGDTVTGSHIWVNQGSYTVKVKAKDIHDQESIWSDPLSISMPKHSSSVLYVLFERMINMFLLFW